MRQIILKIKQAWSDFRRKKDYGILNRAYLHDGTRIEWVSEDNGIQRGMVSLIDGQLFVLVDSVTRYALDDVLRHPGRIIEQVKQKYYGE